MRPSFFFCLYLLLCGCASASDTPHVAVAMSLRPILTQLHAAHPDIPRPHYTFAASGLLQQQILQGAPFAAFLSAGSAHTERLRVFERKVLAHNPLHVVSTQAPCPPSLAGLVTGTGTLGIGNPRTVPVGRYAREALAPYWERLQPRLRQTENAYQNVLYLKKGAVQQAVVYQSDLQAFPSLSSCFPLPLAVPVLALRLDKTPQLDNWWQWIQSPAVKAALQEAGLTPEGKP